ncbi:hypothetical protein DFH09DRAFT_1146694, partial [Mycena vulgaris]
MQQYPPFTMVGPYPYPHPQNVAPTAPMQQAQKKRLPPAIKPYTPAYSTKAVWGRSMAAESDDDDDDDDTVTGQTTTSIASSQSRAPGNRPSQQRRVEHWVHDTTHHAPQFKSPLVPPPIAGSARSKTHHHHHHKSSRKEPPPVWVPAPQGLPHAVSQPVLGQQQPMPMQYAQQQMVWVPAPQIPQFQGPPPHPQMNFGMGGPMQFALPPKTGSGVHAAHKRSKPEGGKGHKLGK